MPGENPNGESVTEKNKEKTQTLNDEGRDKDAPVEQVSGSAKKVLITNLPKPGLMNILN